MSLTQSQVVKAAARDKTYRLFDSLGLYLEVAPAGGKWWRLKYRFERREKRLSLGVSPRSACRRRGYDASNFAPR